MKRKPVLFNLKDERSRHEYYDFKSSNKDVIVLDTFENQVVELLKNRHPSKEFSESEWLSVAQEYIEDNGGENFGIRVYYPWRNQVIRILEEDDFLFCRTVRNRNKITEAESNTLRKSKIGIVGLSVGKSVAITLAMERSVGELHLADFDSIELTNLNRICTSIANIGLKKTVLAAREIAEIDPYLKVVCYDDGINEENLSGFFDEIELVIDECDDLFIKFQLRVEAKKKKIPVLMDTSDRGLIDVERFDLEPDRPIFHGMIEDELIDSLMTNNHVDKREIVEKILGTESMSVRLSESMAEIGKSLRSWPQLASSVRLGGAITGYVVRKIILNEMYDSGRYYVDLDDIFLKTRIEHN